MYLFFWKIMYYIFYSYWAPQIFHVDFLFSTIPWFNSWWEFWLLIDSQGFPVCKQNVFWGWIWDTYLFICSISNNSEHKPLHGQITTIKFYLTWPEDLRNHSIFGSGPREALRRQCEQGPSSTAWVTAFTVVSGGWSLKSRWVTRRTSPMSFSSPWPSPTPLQEYSQMKGSRHCSRAVCHSVWTLK